MLLIDEQATKEIFQKAIRVWGEESQTQMAIGEIGEFLTTFGRLAQKRCSKEDVIDEIADVIIMMTQMALIQGEDAVKERIKVKIAKIKGRLEKYE
jgi:NTP pyrophosphatase (non-canonical NTP hydrolase)